MYKELSGDTPEEPKRVPVEASADVNRLYKKEIAEGVFEITEPYEPDQEPKAPVRPNARVDVVGFDDFFGARAQSENDSQSEKDKIDQILGIKGSKDQRQANAKKTPQADSKPKPKTKAKKSKKQSPKVNAPEPAEPKLSIFKQRMLARRGAQGN